MLFEQVPSRLCYPGKFRCTPLMTGLTIEKFFELSSSQLDACVESNLEEVDCS